MPQQHRLRSAENKHNPQRTLMAHPVPTHGMTLCLQKERGFFHDTILLPEGNRHILGSSETPPPVSTCSTCTALGTALLNPLQDSTPAFLSHQCIFKQYHAIYLGTSRPHGHLCIYQQPQTRVTHACACPEQMCASTDLKYHQNILVLPA